MLKKTYWFIFSKGDILLADGMACPVPLAARCPVKGVKARPVGTYKGLPCKTLEIKAVPQVLKKYKPVDLRSAFKKLDKRFFALAAKSAQILFWDNNSRYCPACGAVPEEFSFNAKKCPACAKELYPVISTAVMVLVKKGGGILMVRGKDFKRKYHGLVAGFLETGETLEECCKREVLEETNIKIKNLRYFKSQPWPFPSGMMIGFSADYAGGKLKVNTDELSCAAFFERENLPPLPSKISLARQLVDAWLKKEI